MTLPQGSGEAPQISVPTRPLAGKVPTGVFLASSPNRIFKAGYRQVVATASGHPDHLLISGFSEGRPSIFKLSLCVLFARAP